MNVLSQAHTRKDEDTRMALGLFVFQIYLTAFFPFFCFCKECMLLLLP